jgi:hypothetical protein
MEVPAEPIITLPLLLPSNGLLSGALESGQRKSVRNE